uniref:NADH dehydrogenase [ubiquinone] 1 alpha subcomplex subunit 11 n=1 Tax=Ascaris lumbricoides TaxID=6252 RepID=A0A0M3HPH0_ASCLU
LRFGGICDTLQQFSGIVKIVENSHREKRKSAETALTASAFYHELGSCRFAHCLGNSQLGRMGSEKSDEPLVATYRTNRPPWIGLWSNREYKGRKEWWGELGLKDEVVQNGKLRMLRARYREEDPDWWDPKVPDGTSLAGPFGLDSKKYPNLTSKADQPGPLPEFQEKVYKTSHQYKAIAEKYDLSKEHPGLGISPTLTEFIYTPKNKLGRNALFPNSWYHFGPRFFDKPLNEGTFEKGLACAKYAAILLGPYTMLEIRAMNSVTVKDFTPRAFMKRYFQLAPIPLAVAFTWGVALSTAATIRHKDDVYNHFYSSAAVGTVLAAMKHNFAIGLTAAVVTLVLGNFWQYARVSETGLQTMVAHQQSAGIWGGPLAWKWFQKGDIEVPTTKYPVFFRDYFLGRMSI